MKDESFLIEIRHFTRSDNDKGLIVSISLSNTFAPNDKDNTVTFRALQLGCDSYLKLERDFDEDDYFFDLNLKSCFVFDSMRDEKNRIPAVFMSKQGLKLSSILTEQMKSWGWDCQEKTESLLVTKDIVHSILQDALKKTDDVDLIMKMVSQINLATVGFQIVSVNHVDYGTW